MISPTQHVLFQHIVNNAPSFYNSHHLSSPNSSISSSSTSTPSNSIPLSPISPNGSISSSPSASTSKCKKKKQRKQRTVKNGYIDISDVREESGYNYNKWISISKEKLKVLFTHKLKH